MTTELQEINNKLDMLISANISNKQALTLTEASKYIGISKTYMYQLTCKKAIPHYKPNGKQVYFDRLELDKWLLTNSIGNNKQIAKEYTQNNREVA